MTNGSHQQFQVGAMLDRRFQIFFRNFLSFGLIALIIVVRYGLLLFYDLRVAKEGIAANDIARVFD